MWTHVSDEDSRSDSYEEYSDDKVSANSFLLTVGGIKTITRNFNVFAGLGFGYNFSVDDKRTYDGRHWSTSQELEKHAALPIEIGFQWTRGKINIMAGCTGVTNFKDDVRSKWNINPFVGVGITL